MRDGFPAEAQPSQQLRVGEDPHILQERIGLLSRATDRERERLDRWVEALVH